MDADKLAENTQNAPKFFGQICLPKPKNLKKAPSGTSVRAVNYWKVARATINNIGGYRHGFNLKAFGSTATAGARKEYMEQAKNGQSAP